MFWDKTLHPIYTDLCRFVSSRLLLSHFFLYPKETEHCGTPLVVFTGESMMKYAALSLALLLGLSGNLLAAEPEQTQDNSTEPCSNVRNTDDNDTPWSGSERCNDSSGAESDYSDSSSSDESSVTPDQPAPMAN